MPSRDSSRHPLSRRRFLTLSALGAGAVLARPGLLRAQSRPALLTEDLRFAIVSDIHLVYQPDRRMGCALETVSPPEERQAAFLRDAAEWGADVIIDLGDLHPGSFDKRPGKKALEAWNAWPKEKIAVFGNHDGEGEGMSKELYLEKMGMPAPYYTRTIKGWTFIVLDSGNPAIAPGAEGKTWGEEQLPWLRDELRKASGRCVILVHHGRDTAYEKDLPPKRTKAIIDEANNEAGYRKVVAYFWGHVHNSWTRRSGGVHYVHMNSANYRWIGKPLFYRDPAPYAMGVLTADGSLQLRGTGIPDNWAIDDCDQLHEEDRPNDDRTYQVSIS